ncbi:GMC oxidoreductase [Rhizobium sp. WYJ-E13]|uniref:GMC oxidoreductase n=1 Tax=Rhizobium sp. WYJ-E13 TaxID=2849093 RepID=UPI001C1EF205|nr:GMC oxidoreductase [Rhizobium sp. WYJ-E13]QWW69995.1 FAD-dependent monooxygenase [Rhizobium sp. WYJ-E13]
MISSLQSLLAGRVDVCVVGSGPVGLALGIRLARSGLSVALLESGGKTISEKTNRLAAAASISTAHHAEASLTIRRAVGGTSKAWGGRCVEFDDSDFDGRPARGDARWPIEHSAFRAYYDDARTFLGAELSNVEIPGVEMPDMDGDFEPSIESWAREPDMAKAHGALIESLPNLHLVTQATVIGLDLDREGARMKRALVWHRGKLHSLGATIFVLACGGRENARLLLAAQEIAPRLFGGVDGPLGRYYMGHLAGELARIRFADRSFMEKMFFRRNGTGAWFRSRLIPSIALQNERDLLNSVFWLRSPPLEEVYSTAGARATLNMIRAISGRRRMRRMSFKAKAPDTASLSDLVSNPVESFNAALQLTTAALKSERQPNFFVKNDEHLYWLAYHSEQLPVAANRVRLSSEVDETGLKRLAVSFDFAEEDLASLIRSHHALAEWITRRRIGTVEWLYPEETLSAAVRGQALDGYHQIGLTRMGASPRTSVVDGNCRCHDLENLYVAGSSVLPVSGQANPTLPAVALALRLADHLKGELRG